MVVQLNDEILARLTPVENPNPNNFPFGAILLDGTANSSPTLQRARRVWIDRRYGYYRDYSDSDLVLTSIDRTVSTSLPTRERAAQVRVARVGQDLVNPTSIGDEVVVVAERNSGRTGHVIAVLGDGQVRVQFSDHGAAVTSLFLKLDGEPRVDLVPAPPTEEDLKLSAYWIDRIKTHAAQAKARNGFCSQIDKIVAELLEPALPKFTVAEVVNGYDVLSPEGVKVAWFAAKAEAEADAKSRTKKLNA